MNQRRHMTIVSGAVALLAAAPLNDLFLQWTWVVDAVIVVLAVTGALVGVRALRAPVWAQPLLGLLALLLITTWLNPSGREWIGFIPNQHSLAHLRDLFSQAGLDIRQLSIPVPDTRGLLLIAMVGVGAVALVIDFVTVVLHKPALAGLPMLAIYAVPVAIDDHSVNLISFVISAFGYSWLLVTDNIDRVRLFGRRFTGDGRGVDMWEPSPLASVGKRIAVVGTLLAVIIPAAAPGMTKGFFDGVGTGNGGDRICPTCPPGTNVDLVANLSGQLRDSKTVKMLDVTTTDPTPPYVRLGVASTLTNRGFLTAPSTGSGLAQGIATPYYDPITGQHADGVDYKTFHASIRVTNLIEPYLPIYDVPTDISNVSQKWRWDNVNDVVFSTSDNTTNNMTYDITYARAIYTDTVLRAAPEIPADSPARNFIGVPSHPKEVDRIINNPKYQSPNEYDRVSKLYNYLSFTNGFTYDLQTQGGTTGSDIGNFLTNKVGYCVQYAATLAWLVRAAGYPARVAFGFTTGSQTKPNEYTMTNQNLHAWTEVYFEGLGWIPFDATPPVAGAVGSAYAPLLKPQTPTGPDGPDPTLQPSGPAPSGSSAGPGRRPLPEGSTGAIGGTASKTDIGPWVLIGLLIVLAAALSPLVARTVTRSRRSTVDGRVTSETAAPGEAYVVIPGGESVARTRQRVHSAWDEYIDTLVDYDVPVDLTETPRTSTARVVTSLYLPNDVANGVRSLGAAEERARYAREPGESEPFAPILRSLRRAISSRVSWRTRMRATLLPPSVTQRWRAASTAWWIRMATRSQRGRDVLGRVFSPRRWFTPRRA